MEKIKFRAKRLDNGKWVFGVPIPNSYGDRVFFIPLLLTDKIAYPFERLVDWVVEVMPETIGQYTGLKDKDGAEIYEGDIIRFVPLETSINNRVVKFEKGVFKAELTRSGSSITLSNFHESEIKVIGNIYENPDLLEVEE